MPTAKPILVVAYNWRDAMYQARQRGLTWSHCTYVANPDTIRQLGGTRNLEVHYMPNWNLNPNARAIEDALFTSRLWDWAPTPAANGIEEAAGTRTGAGA